ncbi:MAG: acetyl-CoA carboxylase biotin carboxyl carrier protein [Fuerstiella sp.]|nr:acetyl-CoA carboxylase biotin carboxyl carrier protein [Fuerstiella sp.]
MAKPEGADKGSFDLDKFRKLLQLMEKHGVTEANLQKDGESWKVRRGPKQVTVAPEATVAPPVAAAPVAAAAAATPPPAAEAPAAPAGITIDAPTVGTFYSSPTPEDPVFVNVGSTVQPDTTICIIEAMKVFNQIPAEKSGRIVEVLVANGDPVEFGQPLFRIEPA